MIGIIITARMGSTRLRDKHFSKVGNNLALGILLETVLKEFANEVERQQACVIIATGTREINAPFDYFSKKYGVHVFYGHSDNIPLRHSQVVKNFSLTGVLAIDGDDLFCSFQAMRWVYSQILNGFCLAQTDGLPIGMNCWGYLASTLKLVEPKFVKKNKLETGWGIIFEQEKFVSIKFHLQNSETIRSTLDYEQDLCFFEEVISQIPEWRSYDVYQLCKLIVSMGLNNINIDLEEKYWLNFKSAQNMEG